MRKFTQAEIDDMVAEHERRQRAHDEALLDDMGSGRQIDLMLAEAVGQTEDSFFEQWDEMSFQEKYEYASFTCPGFDPLAVVHDIDESAHYRACPDRDRGGCCRCSGCEGCGRCWVTFIGDGQGPEPTYDEVMRMVRGLPHGA